MGSNGFRPTCSARLDTKQPNLTYDRGVRFGGSDDIVP